MKDFLAGDDSGRPHLSAGLGQREVAHCVAGRSLSSRPGEIVRASVVDTDFSAASAAHLGLPSLQQITPVSQEGRGRPPRRQCTQRHQDVSYIEALGSFCQFINN